jgi:hypothetical protein
MGFAPISTLFKLLKLKKLKNLKKKKTLFKEKLIIKTRIKARRTKTDMSVYTV